MATADHMEQPAEVATKVLRRAQVSKMTRALQNRLALANVKIKHGWENLSIDTIEPKIELELKRKRPSSSNDALSDASSSVSDRFIPLALLDSSPLAAPIFSSSAAAELSRSASKRSRYAQHQRQALGYPGSSNHARVKVRSSSAAATKSWKAQYRLPESSPVLRRRSQQHYSHNSHQFSAIAARLPISHGHSLSFISESSTVPDETASPLLSEDDDEDLPLHSFQVHSASTSTNLHSSPPLRSPRTPPPGLARSARMRQDPFTGARSRAGEEDDANLLMYLATSPSPAAAHQSSHHSHAKTPRIVAPSTPPPKSTPLPSSMMSTPGGGGAPFAGFGLNTPGASLNFSEFLNMTPSPGQMASAWARTPATGKTPMAAREARRRLNFDNLIPPSPLLGGGGKSEKPTGLGMDLGGELVS